MERMNKQYKTVDEYIIDQPIDKREILETLRATIQTAVPQAQESISYQMPCFKYHGILIYYAVFKNHYSIFVPRHLEAFKDELATYKKTKATVNMPFNKPVPTDLIRQIVEYVAIKNEELSAKKTK